MMLPGINCMQSKIEQNDKKNTLCYVKKLSKTITKLCLCVCVCVLGVFLCVYCIYTSLLFKINALPLNISNKDMHFYDNYL